MGEKPDGSGLKRIGGEETQARVQTTLSLAVTKMRKIARVNLCTQPLFFFF